MSRKYTYTYNLRGQLKGIDTPGFVQTLNYDDGPAPCNTGNMPMQIGGVTDEGAAWRFYSASTKRDARGG